MLFLSKIIRCLFLMLFLGFASISISSANTYFKYITNENGLSHNTVFDICQDNEGFMWFATENGLNRYDGQNIKKYFHTTSVSSLPNSSVRSLLYTPDEKFFLGTLNGLAQYQPDLDNFKLVDVGGEPLNAIIHLSQGFDKEILISTENSDLIIYDYEKETVKKIPFINERIYGSTTDKEGYYWAFSRFTLYRFNKKLELTATFHSNSQHQNSAFSSVWTDSKGTVWVGTFSNGLLTYDFESKTIIPFINDKMDFIRTMEEDYQPDWYWVGTEKGMYKINVRTKEVIHQTQSFDKELKAINDNAIYKIYKNKQNVLFVGTYFGGVNILNNNKIGFNSIFPSEKPGHLHGKALSQMAAAPDGKIWIATEDAGIAIFDKNNQSFSHLRVSDNYLTSLPTNNVHALLMDDDVCWAGFFNGGLAKIDLKTHQNKKFKTTTSPTSLNNNFVFSIFPLSKDTLMIGKIVGIDLFDKNTEQFSRFRENELYDTYIYDIFEAPDGRIWICTYNNGIFIYDRKSNGLMVHHVQGSESGLPSNTIISYCVDSKKRIWVGTRGEGLCRYDEKSGKFISYASQPLFNDNVIYGIVEDEQGMLWISTNNGISRIQIDESKSTHFTVNQGIAGNQYNYKSYFKDSDGAIYFGSIQGLTWFHPNNIKLATERPDVYFSNFSVFNENVEAGKSKIIDKQINSVDVVKLKFNQRSFTVQFAAINYSESEVLFQYYLEGFEDKWSPLTDKLSANYTNIPSGRYVFHVRAVNKINNLVSEEKSFVIRIKPHFLASWPAFLVYLLGIIALAYGLFKYYHRRQNEKMKLAVQEIERENLQILHQHKMNFFTNISHEFKTPLSIILASIDMLSDSKTLDDLETREINSTIKRSAGRLLNLINQLMDFRKIESEHAQLHLIEGNLIDFTNGIISNYFPLLQKKNIVLNERMSYFRPVIKYDFDKLEKIITNLLTNAVKYSSVDSMIDFSMDVKEKELIVKVRDYGKKGMTEEQRKKIFEAFYSDDTAGGEVESSGIGLALTASLIKFLNGTIDVNSKVGEGSEFIVTLPMMYEDEEAKGTVPEISSIQENIEVGTEISLLQHSAENNDFTLVLVEDNKDLLKLMKLHFSKQYTVRSFENGEEAWQFIQNNAPDAVVTDIMMPIMDGISLCNRIKSDANLCHIPVIMLTAKTNMETRLKGLHVGADAFINKPFLIEELDLRVSNLLKFREIVKKRFFEIAKIEGLDLPAKNVDQTFVERIYEIVDQNLENNKMDVQFIADTLHISRTGLHNRIKKILGISTTDFINTIRINKAKEMIRAEELTFSEIAYKTGYNDSAYFSRIFKKITGLTPGQYKTKLREE